jgi:hypothetical protein
LTDVEHIPDGAGVIEGERERELVDLVRLDYDATLRAVSSLITTAGQIRTIGIAAWGVVLGLAVGSDSLPLALVDCVLVLVFAYGDAYHAALYRRALGRAVQIESLLDERIDQLGIDADDPDAIARTRAKFEMHRFGVQRSLRRPGVRDLFAARPRVVFWAVYPMLLLISLVAAVTYV